MNKIRTNFIVQIYVRYLRENASSAIESTLSIRVYLRIFSL